MRGKDLTDQTYFRFFEADEISASFEEKTVLSAAFGIIFIYKVRLNILGVVPVRRRNIVVKWLWLAKPTCKAISAIVESDCDNSFLAQSIRRATI